MSAAAAPPRRKRALVFGMYFAGRAIATAQKRGSEAYRDRRRLLELERLGYEVFSICNREMYTTADSELQRHVSCDWQEPRNVVKAMRSHPLLGGAAGSAVVPIDAVFLDYFRFPIAYASKFYGSKLFSELFTLLYYEGFLSLDATIVMMHHADLHAKLRPAILRGGFCIDHIHASRNDLYNATERLEAASRGRTIDGYTNAGGCISDRGTSTLACHAARLQ